MMENSFPDSNVGKFLSGFWMLNHTNAAFIHNSGEQAVYHLFSKHTHKQFSYSSMATMLVVYFVMACWAAGTSIASGVVVPMLLIGGIYGRMVGCLLVDQFGIQVIRNGETT